MVTEAIAIKVLQEDREAQEKQQAEDEKNRWKKDVDHLKQFQ